MDLMDFEDVMDLVVLEGRFRTWRMGRSGLLRKCFIGAELNLDECVPSIPNVMKRLLQLILCDTAVNWTLRQKF